jgi:class 3 adenylate cyclase/tetratricopeptide (TPR) repeat protein
MQPSCSSCGADLPPASRFCNLCGQAVGDPLTMPAAGERAPRDYTPRHIADKILNSRSALEGERKQVTVLFADVKSSTQLAGDVDAEDWHAILDRFFQLLSDGVHRFEGTVNQYTGDGIMALFGAPIAHEDHAQRACYTALHLMNELRLYARELKRERGLDFSVRFGIHSGEVVVGRIGDDLRMDYTAQGHTVNVAARLQTLAEGGKTYLSDATAELAQGYFELEDLGEFALKGIEEPMRAHDLLGIGALRTRFDASLARGLARFVGRAGEMQTLESALARAREGNGQVVGIVAEAGTGKSRLCFEFVQSCRARSLLVMEGRAVAHGKNIPFVPVMELIRDYFNVAEGDDDRSAREKVAGRMLLIDEQFREVLPLLFEFMGIGDPGQPAPPLPPEARQRQLFGVLRKLMEGGPQPGQDVGIILIEDLHWLDPGSEPWIAEWVAAAAGTRNLVVLNFRPEYRADWMKRVHYQQLALAPLGPEAIRELLEDLLGSDPSTAGLAETIHARTAGNPFFAEEVVQGLIESGQLSGQRGAYRLDTPVERLEVPQTVQALLAARIDRLMEREKQALQAASVIGKVFELPLLEAVAEMAGVDLEDALARLKDSEFVYEQALFPVPEYAFKHPLTQEVALGSLLREKRRALHADLARVIEARSDKPDEEAALLAHHWDEAGEPLAAAGWHMRAAAWIGHNDFQESARHANAVLEHLRQQESEPGAAALLGQASAWLTGLGWRLGNDPQAASALYEDGKRWAQAAGDIVTEARLAGGYGAVLAVRGELPRSMDVGAELERHADALEDEEMRLVALAWMTYPRIVLGRLDEAQERADAALPRALADPEAGVGMIGSSVAGFLAMWMVDLHMRTRSLVDTSQSFERALRISKERRELETECFTHANWAEALARYFGDRDRAMRHAELCMRQAETLDSPLSRIYARYALGLCLSDRGETGEAIELLEQALAESTERQIGLERNSRVVAELATAWRMAGEIEKAETAARKAEASVIRTGSRIDEPTACLALAAVLLSRRDPKAWQEAAATLDRAEAVARETGAVNELPRIAWRRAELARVRGDAQGRERALRTAREGFAAIGTAGFVAAIDRELADR